MAMLEQIARTYGMNADYLDWHTGLIYQMPRAVVNPDNSNELLVPVIDGTGVPYGTAHMERPCLE